MPEDQLGPSSQNTEEIYQEFIPVEAGELDSDTDLDPSVLQVSAVNWAKYVGVKNVQYIKMGHAPRVNAEEANDWDLANAVRETEKRLYWPPTANDWDNQQPQPPQDIRLPRASTSKQHAGTIHVVQKTAAHKIRPGLQRRKFSRAKKCSDHGHLPSPQRPHRHQ